MTLSPASIRNVMSDLEHLGLIYAPHTSAGRLPTELGLRLFVDGLLEIGDLTDDERRQIEAQLSDPAREVGRAGAHRRRRDDLRPVALRRRGARRQAGEQAQAHRVRAARARQGAGGAGRRRPERREPRDRPAAGLPPSSLIEAANYLNAHIRGLTLAEARATIEKELASAKAELDQLTQKVIEAGLATWSGALGDHKSLIVRGQANLLKDIDGLENLERIRQLFDDLETKRDLVQLLGLSERGEGVHIFIGSENKLFSLSGSSLIVAPFEDQRRKIVGVLGVIGPTRLNYARIIPMVDYTAKLVGRLLT